jgi:hypothetical protein
MRRESNPSSSEQMRAAFRAIRLDEARSRLEEADGRVEAIALGKAANATWRAGSPQER